MYDSMRDEMQKIAIVGPATSAGSLFIPDVAGYAMGRKAGRKKEKRELNPALKMLLIPGGIGHELGYRKGLSEKKSSVEKIAISPIGAMQKVYKGLTGRGIPGGPAIIQARGVRDYLKLKQRGAAIREVGMLRKITPKIRKPA